MRSQAWPIAVLVLTLARAALAQPTASFPAPEEEPAQSAERTPVALEPQSPPPAPPGAQPYAPLPYRYPVVRDQIASAPEDEATESRWYGWQILIADGLSIAAFASGVSGERGEGGELAVLGVVSYALVPGAIHSAHGRAGAALGSVGLRLGGPLIGAWLGSSGSERSDELGGIVVGFMLGIVGAIAIDVSLLAHESVPKRDRATFGISVAPTDGGVRAGVIGSF